MRKAIFLIGILALLPLANAQTQEVNVGIIPSSPIYFLDRLFESIQLMIASDVTKINLRAKFLDERLVEFQYVVEKKPQFTSKALAEIKKGTDDLAKEADLKPKQIKENIEQNIKNSKIVLEGILARFENDNNTNNNNAIAGLKIAIENQENKIDDIEDSKDENEIDIKIKGDIAEVKAVINNQKIEYKVASADVSEILNDISTRTGVSVDTIKNADVEVEDKEVEVEVENNRLKAKIRAR